MKKNLMILTNPSVSTRHNYRASFCSVSELNLNAPQLSFNSEQKDQDPTKLSLNYTNKNLAVPISPRLKAKEYDSTLKKPGFSKSPTVSPRSLHETSSVKGSLPQKEKSPQTNRNLSQYSTLTEKSPDKSKACASLNCFSYISVNCPEKEQKKSKSCEDSETGKKIVEYLGNTISLLDSQIFAFLSINEKTVAEVSQTIEKISNEILLFRENVQMKNCIEENKIKSSQSQISKREYQSTVENLKNIEAESDRRFTVYQRSFEIAKKVFCEISEQLVNAPIFKQENEIIPTIIPQKDEEDDDADDTEEASAFAKQKKQKENAQMKEPVAPSNFQRIKKLKKTLKQEIAELDEIVNENANIYIPNSQIKNVRKPTNSNMVVSCSSSSSVFQITEDNLEENQKIASARLNSCSSEIEN